MKALVYKDAFSVAVEDKPDARIERPQDAVVRITTTNICGSDLHMYEGRAEVESGKTLGHESMGIVQEVGAAVDRIAVGDRVSVPFNVACGTCDNCLGGYTGFCLRVNEGMAGGAYGYSQMGPYEGGQAEYLRVPYADFNLLELPPGDEHELDYTMLSDIFPTGWHGCEMAGVAPGHTVAVYGGGPVGLMAAHSAFLRGAAQVWVVDKAPDRLALAEQYGATPVDFSKGDPVDQIMDATKGRGVDCGVEAVGYQAHDHTGEEHPELVLDNLVGSVRPAGAIGIVGVYVPEDPGASDDLAKEGRIPFQFGTLFQKGLRLGTGQCNTKAYNRQLRDLITAGRASPGRIVSHELPLGQAPDAYDKFDKRVDGYTKVVLHPAA